MANEAPVARAVKESPEGRVSRGAEPGKDELARKHLREEAPFLFSAVPLQIVAGLSEDPLALTCGLACVAYLVAQVFLTSRDKPAEPAPVQPARKRPKSQLAVGLNQQLTLLNKPDEILAFAVEHTGKTDIVNVVTAIHRSTKIAYTVHRNAHAFSADPRLGVLLEQLLGFLQEPTPVHVVTRAVGNTAWALGKLHYQADTVQIWDTFQRLFSEHAEAFKPEELMNTVWAFTVSGAKNDQARALEVARASTRCVDRFADFTLQQVVYFAWAIARLVGIPSVRSDAAVVEGMRVYKHKIVERMRGSTKALTTKNLSMLSWAIAHLHVKIESGADVKTVLAKIGDDAASRQLRSFAPGELSSIVWALNKCSVGKVSFFDVYRKFAMEQGFARYSSQDLANIICAYASPAVMDDVFLMKLGEAAQAHGGFNRLEKMMVHWAFSQHPHLKAPKLGFTAA